MSQLLMALDFETSVRIVSVFFGLSATAWGCGLIARVLFNRL